MDPEERARLLGLGLIGSPMPIEEYLAQFPKSEPKPSLWQRMGEVTQTPEYQGAGISYTPPQSPADAAVSFASRFPVAGEAIDAYDLATAIRDRKPLQGGLAALSLALPFVSMAAMKRGAGDAADAVSDALPAPRQPIKAYHGSPHDFDKFDLSKIGTGEGAQVYGHGLYFAENEDVARSYRDMLGEGSLRLGSGESVPYKGLPEPEEFAYRSLDEAGSIDRAIADIEEGLAETPAFPSQALSPSSRSVWEKGLAVLRRWKADGGAEIVPGGKMYEVAINADPEDFLDYDAPLSQQPPKVRKALEDVLGPIGGDYEGRTGKSWMYDVGATTDPEGNAYVAASEALRQRGVPGVRYYDGMSRGAGEGTRNYVVFDDSLVEILKKYGLAGLLGAGLANRFPTEEER